MTQFAYDLLNITTNVIGFFGGILAIYIFIIFLPLIVRIMIRIITGLIYSQLRIDVSPILDFFLLPGSLLRTTIIWYYLSLKGYRIKLAYFLPTGGENNNVASFRPRGFSIAGFAKYKSDAELSPLRMAFIGSIVSYGVMPIVMLMFAFRLEIMAGMYLMLPSTQVVPLFNFLLISLLFGGMPVPAETLTVVNVFIMTYPHLVLNFVLNVLASLIIAPYIGAALALMLLFFAETLAGITQMMRVNENKVPDLKELIFTALEG